MAIAGGLVYGLAQVARNALNDRPLTEGVGSQVGVGMMAGMTMGATTVAGAGLQSTSSVAGSAAGPPVVAVVAPAASHPGLQNAISALFRAGDRIPGGTAGAVIREALSGSPTGGVWHYQKAVERMAHLRRLLRSGDLDTHDSAVARGLLNDLQKAVTFADQARAK